MVFWLCFGRRSRKCPRSPPDNPPRISAPRSRGIEETLTASNPNFDFVHHDRMAAVDGLERLQAVEGEEARARTLQDTLDAARAATRLEDEAAQYRSCRFFGAMHHQRRRPAYLPVGALRLPWPTVPADQDETVPPGTQVITSLSGQRPLVPMHDRDGVERDDEVVTSRYPSPPVTFYEGRDYTADETPRDINGRSNFDPFYVCPRPSYSTSLRDEVLQHEQDGEASDGGHGKDEVEDKDKFEKGKGKEKEKEKEEEENKNGRDEEEGEKQEDEGYSHWRQARSDSRFSNMTDEDEIRAFADIVNGELDRRECAGSTVVTPSPAQSSTQSHPEDYPLHDRGEAEQSPEDSVVVMHPVIGSDDEGATVEVAASHPCRPKVDRTLDSSSLVRGEQQQQEEEQQQQEEEQQQQEEEQQQQEEEQQQQKEQQQQDDDGSRAAGDDDDDDDEAVANGVLHFAVGDESDEDDGDDVAQAVEPTRAEDGDGREVAAPTSTPTDEPAASVPLPESPVQQSEMMDDNDSRDEPSQHSSETLNKEVVDDREESTVSVAVCQQGSLA